MRQYLLLFLLLFAGSLPAQVRVAKLVIKPNEVFMLAESDILVADTLIMMDSSTLVLNKLKTENFLRVKVARFGSHCTIDGSGIDGKPGRNGIPGITPIGPCINGSAGKDGTRGLDGTKGLNLFMYLEKVTIAGQLTVDLSGGRGGQGGNGGNGGGGSPGTLHCFGGDGGNGGAAGQGGNGGNGGVLTITVPVPQAIRDLIGEKKLFIKTAGGGQGPSGKGGYHGGAGLGPSKKNGKDGEPGAYNNNGIAGEKGDLIIEAN
ncbi:MAG: hypothetical protein OEV24_03335 [Cyclobacteriaceae bacterium]|nr:hypothetical protein [Cyclobacteriaceae bacterium]MDH5247387.1 hypothetical protein [Cyclobacteriaceae bacterium]